MKTTLTLFAIMLCFFSNAQEIDTEFYPEYSEAVARADYDHGKYILTNSYRQIEDSKNGIVYADHWNIAVAYASPHSGRLHGSLKKKNLYVHNPVLYS